MAQQRCDKAKAQKEHEPKSKAKAKREREQQPNSTCKKGTSSKAGGPRLPPHDLHCAARGPYTQSGQDAPREHETKGVDRQGDAETWPNHQQQVHLARTRNLAHVRNPDRIHHEAGRHQSKTGRLILVQSKGRNTTTDRDFRSLAVIPKRLSTRPRATGLVRCSVAHERIT